MYLFKNLTCNQFFQFCPREFFFQTDLEPELTDFFQYDVLFIVLKKQPLTSIITHYIVCGIPDDLQKLQQMRSLQAWVVSSESAVFKSSFKNWLDQEEHTLILFSCLEDLWKIQKQLDLSTITCRLLDLSLLLRIGRNGTIQNIREVWFMLMMDWIKAEDLLDFDLQKLGVQYNQRLQKRNLDGCQVSLTDPNRMEELTSNVFSMVEYLLCACDYINSSWQTTFGEKQVQTLDLYFKFFSPLIPCIASSQKKGICVSTDQFQKIKNQQNMEYMKLQKKFQEVFQMNLMDLQTPQQVIQLVEKAGLQLPPLLFRLQSFESIIMNGESLKVFQTLMGPTIPEVELLAQGLNWRQTNLRIFEWTTKIQNQKLYLSYDFSFIGTLETDPDLYSIGKDFRSVLVPKTNHFFIKVNFPKIRVKIFRELITNIQWSKNIDLELIVALISGQQVVERLTAIDSEEAKKELEAALPLVESFYDTIQTSLFKTSQSFQPYVTSLSGIPLIAESTLFEVSKHKLSHFILETSIFEIFVLILSQIYKKIPSLIFLCILEGELIFQSPQNFVIEHKTQIQKIVQQIGQQHLPSVDLIFDIKVCNNL